MSGYWLMKSEPQTFSIDDLQKKQIEPWDGIRNYQARNFMMKEMEMGDQVLFYHSNSKPPGVVGIMKVASAPYPDFTAWDPKSNYFDPKSPKEKPRWFMVDVRFVRKFHKMISLEALKKQPELGAMRLLQRGNRLSIMPVEKCEFDFILDMEKSV